MNAEFVAGTKLHEHALTYYPPRARWYSRFFYLGIALRRRLALDRIHLPKTMTAFGLVASFVVPGLGVCLRGPWYWGCAAMTGCGLLIFSFFAGFGQSWGNIAFGLLLSAHASGFVYYCSPWVANDPFRSRLSFTFLIMIAVGLLVYWPARSYLQSYWLPLRVQGQVIILHRLAGAQGIRRGDWLMYTLRTAGIGANTFDHGNVWVRNGYGWGPVLGVAGDRIVFSGDSFRVNGKAQPRLPHMPGSGELVVPEKRWFIWPELDITGHGNVGEGAVSATMLQLAMVSEEQIVGKPFPSWFGRRQMTSTP